MSRSGRKRTCARVETSFPDHKRLKRIPFGARRGHALGVWTAALCHSRHRELDGFCPTEALHAFAGEDVIGDLIDAGLFTRDEQEGLPGVAVVNYAEFNDTKQDIKGRLKRDRARKERDNAPRNIRSERDPIPIGIRPDSHPHSVGKLEEKSREGSDLRL